MKKDLPDSLLAQDNQNQATLVKIGDAAKILGVSIDTLRRWEVKGKIPTVRTPGGTRLYSLDVLQRFGSQKYQAGVETNETQAENLEKFSFGIVETGLLLEKKTQDQENKKAINDLDTLLALESNSPQTVNFIPQEAENLSISTYNNKDSDKIYAKIYALLATFKSNRQLQTIIGSTLLAGFLFTLIISGLITSLYVLKPNQIKSYFNPATDFGFQKVGQVALGPFNNLAIKEMQAFFPNQAKDLGMIKTNIIAVNPSQAVLAASTEEPNRYLQINADTQFTKNIDVEGAGVFKGYLIAPNIIYGIVAGNNVTVSGGQTPTISVNIPTFLTQITGTSIPATAGGTGNTTYAKGDILYASDTTTLTRLTIGSQGKVLKVSSDGVPSWDTDVDTDTNSGGTMSSFNIIGSSGSSQSVSNGNTITFSAGDGVSTTSSGGPALSIGLNLTAAGAAITSTTASGSGLETSSAGLSMLRGCTNGQLLKWDSTNLEWSCGNDSGANAQSVVNIKEGPSTTYTGIDTIEFNASDFNVTQAGTTAIIDIDYPNSDITRTSQPETITSLWTFSGGLDSTSIGATTAGTGAFTSLSASSTVTFSGLVAGVGAQSQICLNASNSLVTCSGSSSPITGSGTVNRIPKFTPSTTSLGNSSISDDGSTVTINSEAFTQSGGTANINATGSSATNIGNSTGALTLASGGTSAWTNTAGSLTISTATSGALALSSAGALNFTGAANSTWDIGNNTLSIQTSNNGAITTGTGLLTQGGNVTFSGTSARTITGPSTGGLTATVASGPLTLSTTSSGALTLTSAGAVNITGAANSAWNLGSNVLSITSGNFNTTATGINNTAIGATTTSTGAFSSLTTSSTVTLNNTSSGSGSQLCLSANVVVTCSAGSTVSGSGTQNKVTKWSVTGSTLADSSVTDTASSFAFDTEVAKTIQITDSTSSNTSGALLTIKGSAATGIGTGGGLTFTAGAGATTGAGGAINVTTGAGGATAGTSGAFNLATGTAASGANTGAISLTSGNASGSGNSGNISLDVGSVGAGTAGTITIAGSNASALALGRSGLTFTLASSNLNVSSVGVVTLAGGQTTDITTATASTANAIIVQPGTSSAATGTGAALTLQAGIESGGTTGTGGTLTLKGGNATGGGTANGGAVVIDSGSGATTGGSISVGGSNAASIALGRSGITTTITGSTLLAPSSANAIQINPFSTSAGNTGEFRLMELAANGINYTGFKSPDTLASNIIYTLPTVDGSTNYVLTTSGTGVLSWQVASGVGGGGGTVTSVGTGNGLTGGPITTTGTISIALTAAGVVSSATTSSGSGLEFDGSGALTLLRGCSDSNLLTWDNTLKRWVCNSVSGVGSVSGSATAGQITYWSGTSSVTGNANFTFTAAPSTGTSFGLTNASFAPAAAATGNLASLSFTNGSTNTTGTSVTTGINIAETINAVGSGGIQNTYGIKLADIGGTSGAGTQNNYGILIGNQGLGSTENSYGLYVDNQSGSTNSYSAIFAGGNVGIGTTTPGDKLDLNGPLLLEQIAAPGTTTNRLYNVAGTLTWQGVDVCVSGGPCSISGTVSTNNGLGTPAADQIAIWRSSTSIGGNSNFTIDGTGGTYAVTQSSSTTTGNAYGLTANSLTTGSGLAVTTSSNPAAAGPVSPIAFALTNGNSSTATTINGVDIKFTNNPSVAANTENVVRIQNQVTSNGTDNSINDLLLLDNADTSGTGSTIIADALRITNSGGIASGISNGINFASSSIGTGLNFSSTPTSNYVTGSNWSITAAGAETLASTLNVGGAITAPTSSNTINGLIINSGALSGITGYTQSSGNFSISGAGTFGTATGAISLNGDTTIAANKNLTLTSGTGVFNQTYSQSGSSGGNGQVLGFANTNTANAGTTVGGIDLTPTNTSSPLSGTNTLNVLAFEAGGALGGSDTTNGINFASATGYTNFLKTPSIVISSAGAITGATGVSTTTLSTTSTVTLANTSAGAGAQLCLSSNVVVTCSAGSGISGSGTQNKVTKFNNPGGTQIGDSSVLDTASLFVFDKEVAKTIQIADTTTSNTAGALFTIVGAAGAGSGAGGALAVAGGAGGATGAGGAISITTGAGGGTSGTSGALTIASGTAASGANTGAVSFKSGNAAGVGNSGNVTIDAGSIASGTAGTISIGTINTSALSLGRSGITTTITGALTQSGGTTNINASGTSATNIGNSTGALTLASGGTSAWTNTSGNLTISTATSGTLALTSAGALNLTGAAASTWDIGNNLLSLQTTNNGAITTGTGLLTQGGNVTFSGTSARTITGPTTGGLTITDAGGNLSLSTTSSGTLSLTSAGALNFTGAANSTWNLGANTLALTSSSFSVSSVGVVTLAGGQTADITTATASTANAIVIQPGISSAATGTGAALTLQAGNESGGTAGTGGALTLQGGNATAVGGTRTGGAVTIDSGSGTTAGGAVSIAGTNAASLALGRNGINTTLSGTLRLAGATSGFVGLKGATAAGGTTYTLPSADGSANYVLTTNGAGTLAWQVASGVGGGGGSLTQVGDSNPGDSTAFTSGGTGNSLWFNNNSNVGQLTAATLSTTQTWTLPDVSGSFLLLDPSSAQVDSTSASAINVNKTAVGLLLNLTQAAAGVVGSYTTNDAVITRNVTSSTASLDNGGAIFKIANPSSFTGASDTNDPTEILITNATPASGALFTGNFIDLQRADSAGGAQVSKFKVGATGILSLAGGTSAGDITTISGGTSLNIIPLTFATNSGTGGALTLKGGNETGTTSVGGAVTIDGGTGTSTNGAISIGGTNAASVGIGRNGINTTVSGTLRLAGSSSGFVGLQAASAAGSTTYTLPSADGSPNYVLTTNGSGVLAWQTDSGVGGGGGTVTSSGTPLANRLSYFTSDTNITGSSTFTFNPAVTTGSVLGLSNTSFAVAAAGTGNLANLTFTNGSTNVTGTSITTGLNIAPTNNAAGALGIMTTYGIRIQDLAGSPGAGTQNNYGIRIGNQGLASTETSYGLFVDAQSGSTTSYSAIFAGGNVGIGTNTPDEALQLNGVLHLSQVSAPGTTTDKLYNTGGTLFWGPDQVCTTASSCAASGTVTAPGVQIANQISYFTADDVLAGNSNFLFTPSTTTGNTVALTNSSLTTGKAFSVTATNTNTANTAGGISQNLFDVTNAQSTTAITNGFTGLAVNFTNNPTVAGNTENAVRIQNQLTANTTDNAVASLLLLDNADTSAGGSTVVTDALRITNSGAIAAGVTNGITFGSTTIGTGLNFSSTPSTNYVSGTNWSITAAGAEVLASTLNVGGAITAPTSSNTINGLIISSGSLSGITGYSQGSGAFTATLTTTNAATFSSSTTNSDSLALLPQSSTATNSFTGTITSADLTAARTWTFPDATGTICVSGQACALTGNVTDSPAGAANQVAYFTAADTITGSNNLKFFPTNTTGTTTSSTVVVSNSGLTTGTNLYVSGTSTAVANTALIQDLFDITNAQGTTANTNGIVGLGVNFTNNPTVAGNTEYAARIQNQATTNTTDVAVSALLLLDNADTNGTGSTVVTDALRITNSGAIAAGVTNGITFGSTTIGTGLNFSSTPSTNYVSGTNWSITAAGAEVLASTLNVGGAITAPTSSNTINGIVINSGALSSVSSLDTIATSATALTFAGAGTVSSTTGSAITLDSGTTGNVNVGTGSSAKAITIGNITGATSLALKTGSGGLTITNADTTNGTVVNTTSATDDQLAFLPFVGGSNRFTGTISTADLTANTKYSFPNNPTNPTDTVCLLTLGNCVGAGSGVTQSGTNANGQIAYFTSTNNITSDATYIFTPNTLTGTTLALTNTALTTGKALSVTATNTNTANTAGGVTQNLFDVTNAQSTTALTNGFNGLAVNFTNNPTVAGNTENAVRIQNQLTANTTDNAVASLLLLDNADTSAGGSTVVTDALRITNSGAIAAGVTNGITFGSTTIATGINFSSTPSSNYISGTNFSVTAAGAETLASTLNVGGVITAPTSSNTINNLIINAGALSGITGYTQNSGAFSATLTTTNAATFNSTTANSDSLALAPNTTGSNSFTGTITSADLTAARTYTLPDASGTICVSGQTCALTGSVTSSGTPLANRIAYFTTDSNITGSATLTFNPSATTGDTLALTDTSFAPAAAATGNLANLSFTNGSTNVTGTSVTTGLNIAPTNNAAGGGGIMTTYGIRIQDIAGSPGAGTQNNYGIRIGNQGLASSETSYGLFVDAQSGSTVSYGAVFSGGNVGIGTNTPRTPLDVLSSAGAQMRLTNTDNSVYSAFTNDSSGNLTINSTGTGGTSFTTTTVNGDSLNIKPQTSTATNSFTGTLTSADLTAARTYTLPDATGTICVSGQACALTGTVSGTGTQNVLTKWDVTGAAIQDSAISDAANVVTFAGTTTLTATSLATLTSSTALSLNPNTGTTLTFGSAATTANVFNATTTTLSLGGAATTALNIGNGTTAYTAINLGAGAITTGTNTIHIGDGAITSGVEAITIGSTNSSSSLNLKAGSGGTTVTNATTTPTTFASSTATSDTIQIKPFSTAGATFNGIITSVDLTGSDKTWTFPNASGTVCTTATACSSPGSVTDTGQVTNALTKFTAVADQITSSNILDDGTIITVGTTTGAAALNQRVGTGNFSLDGVAGSTFTIGASTVGGTITLGGTAQTGTLTLGQSTATNTINIGNGNIATGNTQTINIGATATSTGKDVITLGNIIAATSVAINAGSGGINLTNATTTPTTFASSTATSDTIQIKPFSTAGATFNGIITSVDLTASDKTWTFPNASGTVCVSGQSCALSGNVTDTGQVTNALTKFTAVADQITSSNILDDGTIITVGTTTGAAALNQRVGTGNFSLDGVAGSTFTFGASTTTGNIALGGASQTGPITLGLSTAGQTINIGAAQVATGNTQTIHIGDSATGTGKDVITVGNTNGASSVAVNAGSGNIALGATSGAINLTTTTSGNIALSAASTLSLATSGGNNNITIAPNGTGSVQVTSGVTTGTGTTSGLSLASSTLQNGHLAEIASTSTAGTVSDSSYLLYLTSSGANSNTAHTSYGLSSTVTNTNGTSGTNIAAFLNASGATTANYALIIPSGGGNVGIGTTTPSASAIEDLSSTTQGFLTPRMTQTQRDAITSPATGLLIYDTSNTRFEYYNGSSWGPISSGASTKLSDIQAATATNSIDSLNFAQVWDWSTLSSQIAMKLSGGGATALTTGNVFQVAGPTGAAALSGAAGGVVNLTAAGNYTSANNAGLLNLNANSTNGGVVQNIEADALTTGTALRVGSTSTGLTSGSLVNVTSATTGAVTNGIVNLNATGAYSSTTNGGLLNVNANTTTAGTIQNIQGNALTTGTALRIGSTSTGLTTGSLLAVTSATTGAIATNGAVNFTASGAYTSTSNMGFVNIAANSTQSGTIESISGNALTTGSALFVSSTSTGLAGTAVTGSGLLGNFEWNPGSATTATGDLFRLAVGANASVSGNIFDIVANSSSIFSVNPQSFTTSLPFSETAPGDLSIAYDVNFTNPTASYIKSAAPLVLQAGETFNSSNLTLTTFNQGSVVFDESGNTTGTAVDLTNFGTTTGIGLSLQGNALTSGNALNISSSATAETGALALITQSGSATTNTGNVLEVDNTGQTSANVAFYIKHYATATNNLAMRVDDITGDTSPFVIDGSGNVGIGQSTATYKLDVKDSQASNYVMRIINTAISNGQKGLMIDLGAPSASRTINTRFIDFATSGLVYGKIQGGASAVAYTTTAADYAEYFKDADVNNQPEAGEIVSFGADTQSVQRTGMAQDQKTLGIVSTSPGFVGSGPTCQVSDTSCDYNYSQNHTLVSMNGQVPVKVSTENGPIEIGDFLTSSSTPGVAMKATKAGQMIARALENYNSSGTGKITVLVYNGYADPNNTLANMQLDSSGQLITRGIKTNKLELSGSGASLVVNGTSIDASTLLQSGQLASAVTTLQSQYQTLANAINNLTNTQQTLDSRLQTLDSNTNVLGAQVATQSAQLADVNSKVASQSADIAQVSDKLASSSAQIASNSASLNDLSSQVSALLASLANDNNEASDSGNQTPPADNLMPPDTLFATGSATLANLSVDKVATVSGELQAYNATVSNIFKSLGQSFLGNTTIAGNLSVDGTLSLTENSLNVIGSPVSQGQTPTDGILYLQNSSLANLVDIFNGRVTIDKDGNIKATTFTADQININENKSAGEAILPAGQTEIAVFNSYAKSNSIITLTPETVTNQTLAVTDKVDSSGFVVKTSLPAASDIKFSYLIIGQLQAAGP